MASDTTPATTYYVIQLANGSYVKEIFSEQDSVTVDSTTERDSAKRFYLCFSAIEAIVSYVMYVDPAARVVTVPAATPAPFFVIALGGGRYLKAIDEQRGLPPADRVTSTDELAEAMPFDSYFSANDFCTREVLEAYLYASPLRIGVDA